MSAATYSPATAFMSWLAAQLGVRRSGALLRFRCPKCGGDAELDQGSALWMCNSCGRRGSWDGLARLLQWEWAPKNGHGHPPAGSTLQAATTVRPQPNLPPIGTPVVGEVCREVCAADLKAKPHQETEYLPLLGQPGYIAKGWTTLLAGYPKAGKTELMARLSGEWAGESVMYITEEPESIWAARLGGLLGDWSHVRLLFALGMEPADILARIKAGSDTVVVVDTVRNLLGLQDETDNSEVARVLAPFVAAARERGKTLVLLHHIRKGGGEHGEGVTGGHAFLGIVDVALEILREPNLGERKRRVRGWGRLFPIEEAVYELQEDGSMFLLGSPKAVELDAVKQRVQELLSGHWETRKGLLGELDEPRPAQEQLRLALSSLVADGVAERDPKADRPGTTYRYRLAQSQSATSPTTGPPVGGR